MSNKLISKLFLKNKITKLKKKSIVFYINIYFDEQDNSIGF